MPNITVYVTNEDLEVLNQSCKDNSCGLSTLVQALIRGNIKREETTDELPPLDPNEEFTLDGEKIED